MSKLELYLEISSMRNQGLHDWQIAEKLHITEAELVKVVSKYGWIVR